jgi:hypothetical protein
MTQYHRAYIRGPAYLIGGVKLTSIKPDKDRTVTVTHDDASSERKLTFEHPDDGILVHKDWVISRV